MKNFPDSNVRWEILGKGDVCEVQSASAMNKIEHSSQVAVMRRTGEKAKDYTERHQVPKWYDDADELLIQSVADDLLRKDKCRSTGISGARINWVMEQLIYHSYQDISR